MIKIRLGFHTLFPVSKSKKKKKSKIRTGGKKLGHSMEASKLGLVPRIPESQFSLGRNWLARRLETGNRGRERARGEDETCQVA